MADKSKDMCAGCRDDYYNRTQPKGCFNFASAEVVRRFKIGWWTSPEADGAFTEVETLSCHHAPGQYALQKELPTFSVNPRRLPILEDSHGAAH